MEREQEGSEEKGTPKVSSQPDADLIGEGGNTDVCPGRQIPSHRHCCPTSVRHTPILCKYANA